MGAGAPLHVIYGRLLQGNTSADRQWTERQILQTVNLICAYVSVTTEIEDHVCMHALT